jgi:flagellar assembly factor FliW
MNTSTQLAADDLSYAELTIWTVRLGAPEQLTVSPSSLYTFAEALPGLPNSRRFALISDQTYAPLQWLQSLDEWAICLPVLALESVKLEGYAALVAEAAESSSGAEFAPRILLVTHLRAGTFAVNPLAPILLDDRSATGKQLILDGQPYPLRQTIVWDAQTRTFSPQC